MGKCPQMKQGGVALPFTLKKYFKAKIFFYRNSNISPCKNIIFKKSFV
jgi:hypothetical protein